MTFVAATLTAALLLLAGSLLGYRVVHAPDSGRRTALCLGSACLFVLAPWLLPQTGPFERLVVAMTAIVCVHRLWEAEQRLMPVLALRSFGSYAYYFVTLPDTLFSSSVEQRSVARRRGTQRLSRGSGKLIILLGMFALSTLWPELWASRPVTTLWCLWAMYLVSSGIADVAAGFNMAVSGNDAVEAFDAPPLARSPREFWGRRWNMIFRNTAHRLIFVPLLSRSPLLAASLVFVWSAVVHEYVVVASLHTTHGEMTAFFLIQGAATIVNTRLRGMLSLPKSVAIALHALWMFLTSPLFFSPMRQIVRVDLIRLW